MKYLLVEEETSRLRFERVDQKDFHLWLPFFQDPSTSVHWVEPRESAEAACEKWYDKQAYRYENNLGGMNSLIEKSSGELIGYCGLLVQQVDGITELEIGYSLLPRFWNKGYASEAAQKCRDYAFLNLVSQHLISIISITNKPSENVAVKNGMSINKTTIYNGNKVNIFRINIDEWRVLVNSSKNL